MPTKRTPLHRGRRLTFSGEVLALFAALECEPKRRQNNREFQDKSKSLAQLLDLNAEWWTMNHVHDRSRGPCHPPWCVAHHDWHKVRAVREMLLEAATKAGLLTKGT
jgi:hypothetical protein